jgi:hypothetical protein
MAMTNIKLDQNFFIIALTQKLFAEFNFNLFLIFVMNFYISRIFYLFPDPHRQLLSLSNVVYVSCVTQLSPI